MKADLSAGALPFDDATFDAVVCVGTSTYLAPAALDEWLRVVRPGGLIGVTHKTAVWPLWEPRQEELCRSGRWREASLSPPLPYLPGFDESARRERAKVYFYRRQ